MTQKGGREMDLVSAKIRQQIANAKQEGKFCIHSIDTYEHCDNGLLYLFNELADALMFVWISRQVILLKKPDYEMIENLQSFMYGKKTAQEIEPGITIEALRQRLTGWTRPTNNIFFLYCPQSDLVEEFRI